MRVTIHTRTRLVGLWPTLLPYIHPDEYKSLNNQQPVQYFNHPIFQQLAQIKQKIYVLIDDGSW